jgi:hypothetical protein
MADLERGSIAMLCDKWMLARTIDALVVLCVAVIALAGCDSSSDRRSESSAQTTGQTTPSAAQAMPDKEIAPRLVDREVYELTHFTSPSGNIGCVIDTGGVRCDISERDWSPPPRPAACELDYGHGVSIGAGKPARVVCAGDTTMGSGGEPLAYGDAIAAGQMRCESAQSGITCRDVESGHGFSISREAYQLF